MRDDPMPGLQQRPLRGIALKIASVVVFVGMQTSLKAAGEEIPAGQMVFFRSAFALVPVALYLAWTGALGTVLRTDDVPGHLLRGLIGVSSMTLGFFALTRLPYPEWITISYAAPLFSVVLAVVLLKETVRAYRWAAVVVGLVGILVVAVPGFGSGGQASAAGLSAALGGAGLSALAMIQIRRLVRRERTATIVVYFSITCSLIALATLPFGWTMPSPWQATFLVTAGLCGGVGQLLLTGCYRYADTSTIAPFEYVSLILAVAIGYALFDEAVGATTLLGGAIVVSAGIFIIFREHRLGLERRQARGVTPPQA